MWKNLALAARAGDALSVSEQRRLIATCNKSPTRWTYRRPRRFNSPANGSMYNLGQNVNPAAPWPRFFVKSFTRVYDFTTGAMRDDVVRMAAGAADGGSRTASHHSRSAAITPGTSTGKETAAETV